MKNELSLVIVLCCMGSALVGCSESGRARSTPRNLAGDAGSTAVDASWTDDAGREGSIDAADILDAQPRFDAESDGGPSVDAGDSPGIGPHQRCIEGGRRLGPCKSGLTCVVDADPPTIGTCERPCTSNSTCEGGERCVPGYLENSGICGIPRQQGENCDGLFEGATLCEDATGNYFPSCIDQVCEMICRIDGVQGTAPCPSGQACGNTPRTALGFDVPVYVCERPTTTPPGMCEGTASSVPNAASTSLAQLSRGRIALLLSPRPLASLVAGDRCTLIDLSPIPGQTSYPPGSGGRCGLIEWTGRGWRAIEEVIGCELILSTLDYASAPMVCDGRIAGGFRGLLTGNRIAAGTFDAPLPIAESELAPPSCRPRDGRCSSNSDCCSLSCSTFIGVCN